MAIRSIFHSFSEKENIFVNVKQQRAAEEGEAEKIQSIEKMKKEDDNISKCC